VTNTNDLRRLLDELSDQTPEFSAQEWLDGTRHKVRVRRRARWAGAAVATALVLAAGIAAVPQVANLAESEPNVVKPAPMPDGRDGWPFADGMDTGRVIAARRNDPGASEFRWTTSANRLRDIAFMVFCRLPDEPEAGQARVRYIASINGREALDWGCRYREHYPPVHGSLTTQDMSRDLGWTYHVKPNEPFTVHMWLERGGQRVEVPGVAFGFALTRCEVSANPTSSGGVPGCDALDFPGLDPAGASASMGRHGF
jgi:hypothetical protein